MEITQKIQGIQGPFFTPQDWGRICWQGWTTWWPCCLRRAPPRRCQELNFQYVLQTFSNRAFKCSDFSGSNQIMPGCQNTRFMCLWWTKPDLAMPCNPVLQGLDIPLPQYALLHPVMRCASRISMWIWISCLAAKPWCGTISKASSNGLPSRPNSIQFDVKCLVNLYRSKAESPPFPSGLTWADLIAFRGLRHLGKHPGDFFMFFGVQI